MAPLQQTLPDIVDDADFLVASTACPAKKTLSFAPRVAVRHIISLDEYTEEEMQAAWFSRKEVAEIKTLAFIIYVLYIIHISYVTRGCHESVHCTV